MGRLLVSKSRMTRAVAALKDTHDWRDMSEESVVRDVLEAAYGYPIEFYEGDELTTMEPGSISFRLNEHGQMTVTRDPVE